MSQILVTGAAGFVGANVAKALINQGYDVVGVDSINDYYDPALKYHRLAQLNELPRFSFISGDLADAELVESVFKRGPFHWVIHLAAQAGVRYSIENPGA